MDEAIARAIGDKGESEVNKSTWQKINNWIADVWKRIGAKFGEENLTPEQISNLTLEDIKDVAVSELLSGRNLAGRGERKMESPVGNLSTHPTDMHPSTPDNQNGSDAELSQPHTGLIDEVKPQNNSSPLSADKDNAQTAERQENSVNISEDGSRKIIKTPTNNNYRILKRKPLRTVYLCLPPTVSLPS